jgi:hypothetical protein
MSTKVQNTNRGGFIMKSFGHVMATLFLLFNVMNSGNLLQAAEPYLTKPINFKSVIERIAVPFYLSPDRAVTFFDEQRKVVRSVMDKAGILKEK